MQIAGASGHSVNQVISSTGIVSVGEIIMVDKSEGHIWMWIWPKSCIISYASAMLLLCFPYAFPVLPLWFSYAFPRLPLYSPYAFPALSSCFPYAFPRLCSLYAFPAIPVFFSYVSLMLALCFLDASRLFAPCLPYASTMLFLCAFEAKLRLGRGPGLSLGVWLGSGSKLAVKLISSFHFSYQYSLIHYYRCATLLVPFTANHPGNCWINSSLPP